MKTGKNIFSLVLVIVAALLAVSAVFAVPVTIDKVKINGDQIDPSGTNSILSMDRDDQISLKVEVTATDDVNDADIEVSIRGYDHDDVIQDMSDVFDMKANRTYIKSFTLNLPYRMDQDLYKLRVMVNDRDGDTTIETYELDVGATRNSLKINDIIFSPSNGVVSGRALLITVRLANIGSGDQNDGIKVSVSMPELGITAADYMDSIDSDDKKTSEELYLRIPTCAKPGVYDVITEVKYKDGDKVISQTKQIEVLEDETCTPATTTGVVPAEPKTIITIGPTTQDVTPGEGGVIYPLTLSNAGNDAKTYIITVDGYKEWADIRLSPANIIVLQGGESKAVYVYVSAKEDATVGEHMFSVDVTSGAKSLKQFTLNANVVADNKTVNENSMDIKNVLLIGLLVLVILFVILGLIIGFSKMKNNKDDEDDDKSEQTYY
jgi:uncharacterized membrane protein